MDIGNASLLSFRLRLKSSDEIASESVREYGADSLNQTDRDEDNDPYLGPISKAVRCKTCNGDITTCPGHYGHVKLPIPIVHPLATNDVKKILSVVCIKCKKIPIPTEEKYKLLQKHIRPTIINIRDRIEKNQHMCPFCQSEITTAYAVPIQADNRAVTSIVACFSTTPMTVLKDIGHRKKVLYENLNLIDNRRIWDTLIGLSTDDLKLIGYDTKGFEPYRFMTEYVVITTHMARPKSGKIGKQQINKPKRLHQDIITDAGLIRSNLSNTFIENLDKDSMKKLMDDLERLCINVATLYVQLSKEEAPILRMKAKQKTQDFVPYISMLAGKTGIPRKFVLGARHDVSARTVATGRPHGRIGTLAYPKMFAMKTSIAEVVTQKNINFLRMLVMNGPNKYPGALRFYRGKYFAINDTNCKSIAGALKPGDIVERHILTGDLGFNNRYPSLREESVDALMFVVTNEQTFSVPLAVCDKKGLDFDGDEIQAFIPSSPGVCASALLLQSNIVQFIAPKDGRLAIFGSNDVISGVNALMSFKTFTKDEAKKILRSGTYTRDIKLTKESYTPNEIVSFALPSNFYLNDSRLQVEAGNITGGEFNHKAVCSTSAYLLKYIAHNVGAYAAIKVLEDITKFAYTVNRMIGQSQADDLRLQPKPRAEVNKIIDKRVELIDEYAKLWHAGKIRVPTGQNPEEYYDAVQMHIKAQYGANEIGKIILDTFKGTSYERNKYLEQRSVEIVRALGTVGQVSVLDARPKMLLANGSRTLPYFPRYLDTAETRGYCRGAYSYGLDPAEHFIECMKQRKDLYDKGMGVAEQGYFARMLSMRLSSMSSRYAGEIVGDNNRIVAYSYGHMNLDLRHIIDIRIPILSLSDADFEKRYNSGVKEEYEECLDVRHKWQDDYIHYGNLTSDNKFKLDLDKYKSPIDFEYMINKHRGKGGKSKATELWPLLKRFIDSLIKCHCGDSVEGELLALIKERITPFERLVRFALCTKQFINYGKKEYEELLSNIHYKYKYSLIQYGEPVGLKAALNLSETFTQGMLKSIHAKGLVGGAASRLQRVHGITRFKELLQWSPTIETKHPVTTIVLKPELRSNYAECVKFAKKINTVTLNDIMYSAALISSKSFAANDDDEKMIRQWIDRLDKSTKNMVMQLSRSSFKLKLNVNTIDMLLNRVSLFEIQMSIGKEYPGIVAFVAADETLDAVTRMYVYFYPGQSRDAIISISEEICSKLIVHGDGSFRNTDIVKYEGNLELAKDGRLVEETIYRIESNGRDLAYILSQPEVDQRYVFSNNISEMIELYGLAETRARIYEEMLLEARQSDSLRNTMTQHFKIMSDYITYRGEVGTIERHGLVKNDDVDPISKLSFEQPQTFIYNAIKDPKDIPFEGDVPRILYGLQPTSGTGLCKVLIKTSALSSDDKEVISKEMDELLESKPKEKVKRKMHMSSNNIPSFDDFI